MAQQFIVPLIKIIKLNMRRTKKKKFKSQRKIKNSSNSLIHNEFKCSIFNWIYILSRFKCDGNTLKPDHKPGPDNFSISKKIFHGATLTNLHKIQIKRFKYIKKNYIIYSKQNLNNKKNIAIYFYIYFKYLQQHPQNTFLNDLNFQFRMDESWKKTSMLSGTRQ